MIKPDLWWDMDEDDIHSKLFPLGLEVQNDVGPRQKRDASDFLMLYQGNSRYNDELVNVFSRIPWVSEAAGFNVVQSIVDTLASHFTNDRVVPFFVTDNANYELKEKALGMQRAIEALFVSQGIYNDLGHDVCKDGLIFGTGIAKAFPDYDNHRIKIERVPPWDILVADDDARLGCPRQMFQVHRVNRSVVLGRFKDNPKLTAKIEQAQPVNSYINGTLNPSNKYASDQILVVEAWHLPSVYVDRKNPKSFDVGAHDGRHSIVIDGATLRDESWVFDRFPFAVFRYQRKPLGFYGRGIPETIFGPQMFINNMLRRIEAILEHHARPLLVVDKRLGINTNHITNSLVSIIEGRGTGGIQMFSPNSVPSDLIRQVEVYRQYAFEQSGLSQLSASSQKPAGVESGKALRTLTDQEAVRYSDVYARFENFHINLAKISIDAIRMLAEHDKGYKIMWANARDLKMIDWGDVDIEDDRFHLDCTPSNFFDKSVPARYEQVKEAYNDGLISKSQLPSLLRMPDINSALGDVSAAQENIERAVGRILKGSKTEVPDSYMNLDLAISHGIDTLQRLQADGIDDDRAEQVRIWIDRSKKLKSKEIVEQQMLEQPMAPPPEATPGAPPMGPEALPPMMPPEAPDGMVAA